MQRRRLEDISVRILIAAPQDAAAVAPAGELPFPSSGFRLIEYAFDPLSGEPPRPAEDEAAVDDGGSGSVVVLPLGNDQMLFVAGAEVERITHAEGATMLDRAAAEAVAWRQKTLRSARHKKADERLIGVTEVLSRQRTTEGVLEVVTEHAPRVVPGHAAIVMLHGIRPGVEGAVLLPVAPTSFRSRVPELPLQPFLPLEESGEVSAADADEGQPFSSLAPLFLATGAVSVARVPFGDKGLLLLVERRTSVTLETEDWFRLETLARHAAAALDRVQLREQTQALSLTDPVTGLGNRRKLEVVLPYHLAAAERGTPLTLAVLDLVEERDEMRDASLHLLGECLRRHARASDILARYGQSRFVALLPGTGADGARSLLRRVHAALGQAITARSGIAEYGGNSTTLGQLLENAEASFGDLTLG